MDKHIFWLASYPKSGNTLIRAILSSLFFTVDGVFNFKLLEFIRQFESTYNIFKIKNLIGNDLYRLNDISVFYKYLLTIQKKKNLDYQEDFKFFKTHSGNFSINNNAFTAEKNIRGVIYIIRDPRDICVSWANHSGVSYNQSVNFMTNESQSLLWLKGKNNLFNKRNMPASLLSSWDKHVTSWTADNWKFPLLIIKFEDLVYEKEKTLRVIANFFINEYKFKFQNLDQKINNILKTTSFDNLKNQEIKSGFIEAQEGRQFFKTGKKNQWINKLNKDQIYKIEEKFKVVMNKFNYK
ncbi:sulfotransferase domain-containing protein [Pelagibacteraceae bacterium]|nr:sulfotransferase domain-containing protein [Pelagibacteraceae bacterium]